MRVEDKATGAASPPAGRDRRPPRPRRRADVSARVVEGECVILDRRWGLVHQLNATASYIWDRCDGTSTADEIAAGMAERFDVDRATARAAVLASVQRLRELKLLDAGDP